MSIYLYISFFVKLLLNTRKIIIIRKQKIIKRIIFALFLLQKVKFDKNKKIVFIQLSLQLYIIVYNYPEKNYIYMDIFYI